MRKIIVSEFVSLDGVMEDPAWTFKYWNDEIAEFKHSELFAIDALLLGRVTYQGFASAWPSRTDEEGYADRMNSLPKYVVTTTLKSLKWNNSRLVEGDLVEAIDKLKAQPGMDILVFGSCTLVQFLIQNDLVDQYHLLVYPLVLAAGKRLFQEGSATHLRLVDTKPFTSGVTLLIYEPDGEG